MNSSKIYLKMAFFQVCRTSLTRKSSWVISKFIWWLRSWPISFNWKSPIRPSIIWSKGQYSTRLLSLKEYQKRKNCRWVSPTFLVSTEAALRLREKSIASTWKSWWTVQLNSFHDDFILCFSYFIKLRVRLFMFWDILLNINFNNKLVFMI